MSLMKEFALKTSPALKWLFERVTKMTRKTTREPTPSSTFLCL